MKLSSVLAKKKSRYKTIHRVKAAAACRGSFQLRDLLVLILRMNIHLQLQFMFDPRRSKFIFIICSLTFHNFK